MNTPLAQQSNTSGESWMTHEIHLETGDGDDRRGSAPERFTQDTGHQCIADALRPFVDGVKSRRHDQHRIGFGKWICLPRKLVVCPDEVSRKVGYGLSIHPA